MKRPIYCVHVVTECKFMVKSRYFSFNLLPVSFFLCTFAAENEKYSTKSKDKQ